MIPLGWSIGDLLTAIGVLKSVIEALDESAGAKADYQELMKEIYGLERVLITIKELRLDDNPSHPEHGVLRQAIDECQSCIDRFLKPLEKYRSLSSGGSSSLKNQFQKIKWALGHEDDVHRFREAFGKRIASLNLLIGTINLSHVMSSNRRVEEKFGQQAALATEIQTRMSASDVEQTDLLQRIEGLLQVQKEKLVSSPEPRSIEMKFLVRPFKLIGAPLAPAFVPRPSVMDAMEQRLLPISKDQQTILVLSGMGGMGKSQMARDYATKHQHDYTAVFWVNAMSESSSKSDFAKIARRLGLEEEDTGLVRTNEQNNATAFSAVRKWFDEDHNTNWLLVFDNMDSQVSSVANEEDEGQTTQNGDTFDLCGYIPSEVHGSVLVTSRLSYLARQLGGTTYAIDEMTIPESLDLIYQVSGLSPESSGAEALVRRLGCYPLALSQAGRYIQETQMSFTKYLDLYDTRFKRYFGQKLSHREYHHGSVNTALGLSYEALKAKDTVAAALLSFCGCLDNSDIAWELFHVAFNSNSALSATRVVKCEWIPGLSSDWFARLSSDQETYDDAINSLISFSFVRRDAESNNISIHPVVHQWTLSLYPTETREHFLEMAANLVICDFIDEGVLNAEVFKKMKNYALKSKSRLHAERCVFLLGGDPSRAGWDAFTLIRLGAYLTDQLEFDKAQALLEAGRRRLDELPCVETEVEILKTVNLRIVLSQRYHDFAKAHRCLEPAEQQLRSLQSARAALKSCDTPRTSQWAFYDLCVISAIVEIYTRGQKVFEATKLLDQAVGEHSAPGFGPASVLNILYSKSVLLFHTRDYESSVQTGEEVIDGIDSLLHNDIMIQDSFFHNGKSLNSLRAHAHFLVGVAHDVAGNQEESADTHFSRALVAFEGLDFHRETLLNCADSFNESQRKKLPHLWNSVLRNPRILRPSTLRRLNIDPGSSMRDDERDEWSTALNAVRTVVRYRPGTLRYNRLVEELATKKVKLVRG